MLDQNLKDQLRATLGHLRAPVTLELALDASDSARELENLARELVELSPLLSLAQSDAADGRRPVLAVLNPARDTRIEFAGVPSGHEFTSLVLALLHSGDHPPKLEEEVIEQARALEGEFHFEIYISLSCQTCPEVVQALNTLAALNPAVRPVMIDGALFQDEITQRNILAVPTVYLNGERFSQGRIALPDILRKLDARLDAGLAERLNAKAPYDLLLVGGGPAAASGAVYAARKGLRVGLVAETFGGQVLDTLGIENFISVQSTEGPKLVASLEEHVRQYEVDILQGQRATALDERDEEGLLGVQLASGARLRACSLLLATGARWRQVGVPGEQDYKGHGVAYCAHCDGPLFKGKPVAVIGGGNSGLEAAIDLAGITEQVTVLEFADSLKADRVLVDKARSLPNLRILTQAQTTAIEGDGARVTGLRYHDRASGEEQLLPLAGVFVQIGLLPNTDFLKGKVELNRLGEIVTGPRGETSLPGVFAAGDATDSAFKQIIIAMGSGANAALGASDWLVRQGQEVTQDQAKAA